MLTYAMQQLFVYLALAHKFCRCSDNLVVKAVDRYMAEPRLILTETNESLAALKQHLIEIAPLLNNKSYM